MLNERTELGVDIGISQMDRFYDPDWGVMYDPSDAFAAQKPWTNSLVRMYDEITELGLERNILELEVFGYTVVEPTKVAALDLPDRLAAAILAVAEKRTGKAADVEKGFDDLASLSSFNFFGTQVPGGLSFFDVFFEDPAFEEALMNPVALALASYQLGYQCVLDAMIGMLKQGIPEDEIEHLPHGPNDAHVDGWTIEPLSPHVQQVNVTWILTDYTPENGSTGFVPGSHRFYRGPNNLLNEGEGQWVHITAPKGSLVVWGNRTWHMSPPRATPGLRINLVVNYKRPYQATAESFRSRVTQEMIDRNPPRFRALMGEPMGGYARQRLY